MSKLNGYAIDPMLDDSESVLADDESSEVGAAHIDSPSIDSIPDEAMVRSPDSSTDITVSSMSLPSAEHSSVEEIITQKQDVSHSLETSPQRNISKKDVEKTALGCNFEIQINPQCQREENILSSNIHSISRKRVSGSISGENRCLDISEDPDTTIHPGNQFKRLKLEDESAETSSIVSPPTSHKPCETESSQDPKGGFTSTGIKTTEHSNILVHDTKIGAEGSVHTSEDKDTSPVSVFEKDKLKDHESGSNFERVGESEKLKICKGEKRKMSSPEIIDSKIKIQKFAASEVCSKLDKSLCKELEAISGPNLLSESTVSELYSHQINKNEYLLSAQTRDSSTPVSSNFQETKDSPYTNIPETSEISDSSTETVSFSESASSFDEHSNIDLCKLSPAVLDENALLSAPEKSDDSLKFQTSESKENLKLKEVKLSITSCIKKDDVSQNTGESAQSSRRYKHFERSTARTTGKASIIDIEHTVKKQEENTSVLSSDQERLQLSGETSIESSELSVLITQNRESPALIDEIAMISPPDRMKETKVDFSELSVTEKSLGICSGSSGKSSNSPVSKELSTEETSLTASSNIIDSTSELSLRIVDTERANLDKGQCKIRSSNVSAKICDVSEGFGLECNQLFTEETVPSGKHTGECKTSCEPLRATRKFEKCSPSSSETTDSADETMSEITMESSSGSKKDEKSVVMPLLNEIPGSSEMETTTTHQLNETEGKSESPMQVDKSEQSLQGKDNSVSKSEDTPVHEQLLQTDETVEDETKNSES